jgi:hypothetical protein
MKNFSYGCNACPMAGWAEDLFCNILSQVGIMGVIITSTKRTPHDQARIMYENLDGPHSNKQEYIERQLRLYGTAGDQVIHVFEHQLSMGAGRDSAIRAMEDEIIAIGPQKVSAHCCTIPNREVFDVAPSSIPEDKRQQFKTIMSSMMRVTKFIPFPLDPAYHIEITNP